jgi:hypothetical protein
LAGQAEGDAVLRSSVAGAGLVVSAKRAEAPFPGDRPTLVRGHERGAEVVGRQVLPGLGARGVDLELGDGAAGEVEEVGRVDRVRGARLAAEGVEEAGRVVERLDGGRLGERVAGHLDGAP